MTWIATTNRICRAVERRRGFTLIEVAAVIVVMAVLSVTAVVSMQGTGGAKARAAAHSVARDISFARERALATGNTMWVAFSVGTNGYSVLSEDPASPGRVSALAITDPATGRPFVARLNDPAFSGVTLVSAMIPGGGTDLGFDWMGRPFNAAGSRVTTDVTITLDPAQTVIVKAGTGVVSVP